eukprot:2372498-Rhodomonas_salina.2
MTHARNKKACPAKSDGRNCLPHTKNAEPFKLTAHQRGIAYAICLRAPMRCPVLMSGTINTRLRYWRLLPPLHTVSGKISGTDAWYQVGLLPLLRKPGGSIAMRRKVSYPLLSYAPRCSAQH